MEEELKLGSTNHDQKGHIEHLILGQLYNSEDGVHVTWKQETDKPTWGLGLILECWVPPTPTHLDHSDLPWQSETQTNPAGQIRGAGPQNTPAFLQAT